MERVHMHSNKMAYLPNSTHIYDVLFYMVYSVNKNHLDEMKSCIQ